MQSTKQREASCGADSIGALQRSCNAGRKLSRGKSSLQWQEIPVSSPESAGSSHGMQPGWNAGEAAQEPRLGLGYSVVIHPFLSEFLSAWTSLFSHASIVCFYQFGNTCNITSTDVFLRGEEDCWRQTHSAIENLCWKTGACPSRGPEEKQLLVSTEQRSMAPPARHGSQCQAHAAV